MTGQFRNSGRRGRANTVSRRVFGQLLVGMASPLLQKAALIFSQG